MTPKILYLDIAYTYAIVRERELSQEFLSRDCGGFFQHVWGVHPIADIPHNVPPRYEGFRPEIIQFVPNQTIVEGQSAYYRSLRKLYPLNFVVSQIRFLIYLAALIRRERISVILSTDPYVCGIHGVLLKYLTGRPLVIWVIANYPDIAASTGRALMPRLFRWRKVETWIEKIVFRLADFVAGGNQDNLEFAIRHGARREKSTVFPVGKLIHPSHLVEPGDRRRDPDVNASLGSKVLVYVGRLVEMKFPEDVIEAFVHVHRASPDAHLVMVGEGPMRAALEARAERHGISAAVLFTGNVNQQRLSEILASCIVALSPLTGRALLEVALAEVPIVAYDRDWQRDFMERSNGGVIVPFRDTNAMADAAVALLANPGHASILGANARRVSLDLCDASRLYAHERATYEQLLRASS